MKSSLCRVARATVVPARKTGSKSGGGRQDTGAANRHINAAQNRFLDLRWVLECNGPAREFVGGTHQIALCEIVDLDDRTVHIKIELGTILADLFDFRDGILNIMNDAGSAARPGGPDS